MPCKYSPPSHGWNASAGRWSTSSGRAYRLRFCMRPHAGVLARTSSPNARYLLACAALAAMMAAPLVTWGLMRPSDASPDAAYRIRSTPPARPPPASPTPPPRRCPLPSAPPCPACSRHSSCLGSSWSGLPARWCFGCAWREAGWWPRACGRCWSGVHRRNGRGPSGNLGARIGLSRPVRLLVSALVQVPDGGRLAASGGVGPGRGARRSACRAVWRRCCCMSWRTSGGTIIWSTFCRALPKRCCSTTPRSGGCRGTFAPSASCAATMWPCRSRRCAHLCARAGAVGIVPPGASQRRGCRQWGISVRPHRKAAGPVAASRPHRPGAGRRSRWRFCWWPRHTDCSASPPRIPRFRRRRSNEMLLTGASPPVTRWEAAINPAAGCADERCR